MKWNDPIVADVRKTREDLCSKAGGFGPYMKNCRLKTHNILMKGVERMTCDICAQKGAQVRRIARTCGKGKNHKEVIIMLATEIKHLHIEKEPSKYEGKAVIKGTRIPVASIINHYRSGMSIEEILEGYPSITPAQLFDALSYYFDNKDEIDRELAA